MIVSVFKGIIVSVLKRMIVSVLKGMIVSVLKKMIVSVLKRLQGWGGGMGEEIELTEIEREQRQRDMPDVSRYQEHTRLCCLPFRARVLLKSDAKLLS